MPTTFEGILLVMGGLFLLIGLIGGKFEISVAKIPKVGREGWIGSVLVGAVCLGVALRSISVPVASGGATPGQPDTPATALRPAPVARAPAFPDECLPGYVWREVFDGDFVCVTPESRERAARDNALAASRRVGGGGE